MTQLGEQLALDAGQVLRSGRVVMKAMTPKRGDRLASGSPSTPPSMKQNKGWRPLGRLFAS
jgi:hypothetical protein